MAGAKVSIHAPVTATEGPTNGPSGASCFIVRYGSRRSAGRVCMVTPSGVSGSTHPRRTFCRSPSGTCPTAASRSAAAPCGGVRTGTLPCRASLGPATIVATRTGLSRVTSSRSPIRARPAPRGSARGAASTSDLGGLAATGHGHGATTLTKATSHRSACGPPPSSCGGCWRP